MTTSKTKQLSVCPFASPLISGIADINQGYATPEKRIKEAFGHRIASLYVA
jgi:hypothetical protein